MSEKKRRPINQDDLGGANKKPNGSRKAQPKAPERASEGKPRRVGVWRFGDRREYELDQSARSFRGPNTTLTFRHPKSMQLLLLLLEAEGRAVGKDEITDKVWPNDPGAEGNLTTAIHDLRKRLGDVMPYHLVVSADGGGYQMGVPVEFLPAQKNQYVTGMGLPDRNGWTLGQPFGAGAEAGKVSWVWYAQQGGQDRRVVCFAERPFAIQTLRREIEVSDQLSRQGHGEAFVRVLDDHLDQPPYFYLMRELAGQGLREWVAERQREPGGLSQELALTIATQLCDAVKRLHDQDLVHNDIRPANVLVAPGAEPGTWQARLTGLGYTVEVGKADDLAAASVRTEYSLPNSPYRPPEALTGAFASKGGDVYALGVLLFQLVRGDLMITPTGAWQKLVNGAMLREDIECAVAQDPRTRLKNAGELAGQLHELGTRQLRHDLERTRRKMLYGLLATSGAVALMLVITTLALRALSQQRTAAAVDAFLREDLLRQSNPVYGKGVSETLRDAIENVRPRIESRFGKQPRVAARVHEEIAEALGNGLVPDDAAAEFEAAAKDWRAVEGQRSEDALDADMQRATLELKSQRPGSMDRARETLHQDRPLLDGLRHPSSRLAVDRLRAEGMLALTTGDAKAAETKFREALATAEADPKAPESSRLSQEAGLCYVLVHIGKAGDAVGCFEQLLPQYTLLYGRDSGPATNLAFNLAQALLLDDQYARALEEIQAISPGLVRIYGPGNQMSLSALGVKVQAEAGLEHWDAAIPDLKTLAEMAEHLAPANPMAILGYADLSKAECGVERLLDGEAHARHALRLASIPEVPPGFLSNARYSLAYCLLTPDLSRRIPPPRLNEAGRLLGAVDIPALEVVAGRPGWSVNVELAEAQLLFDRGQFCPAWQHLLKAKPAFDLPDSDRQQHRLAQELYERLRTKGC